MYNEIIERFIAAQKAARAAYLSVAAFERDALGDVPEHYRTVELRTEYKTRDELRKMCRTLAGNVVNRARRDFAPCGSRLDIKDQDEHEIAGLDIEDALNKGRVPDIDRLWTSLQARYQGDGGREMAYRQAAGRIVRTFGLNRKSEVKRTRRRSSCARRCTRSRCTGPAVAKLGTTVRNTPRIVSPASLHLPPRLAMPKCRPILAR